MKIFTLPDLGEGLHEAEIVEWHVAAGDEVAADRTIVSLETDKAIVDIPAPYAGRIAKLFGEPGEMVRVGAPLVGFEGEGADMGTVVGEVRSGGEVVGGALAPGGVKAAPAVRALARKLNVDLALATPSGPDGAITAADVERVAKLLAEGGALEPLRGVRRAMASRMAHAHAEVASATIMDDADIEPWPEAEPIMPRLVRALVAGCRAEPGLNAWYDRQAVGRRLFTAVHVGIAVDTAEGLIVPVLRDCQAAELDGLRVALEELIRDARERRVAPEGLRGHTITLSNYGTIVGRYAAPIVVPPTVAILGAGRIAPRVVVDDGRPVVHRVLPLSLTFDHRVVSGGEAGRFLLAVIADLQAAA
jgi:pyruvate dehydrogenase E2 component (dihydrolipoamide acetyltransferase)